MAALIYFNPLFFFLSPSSFNSFFIARVWLRPISGPASCRDIILFSSVNEDTEFFKSTSSQTPRFVLFILACLLFFSLSLLLHIPSSILRAVKPYAADRPAWPPCPVPFPPNNAEPTSRYQGSCQFIKWIHRLASLQGQLQQVLRGAATTHLHLYNIFLKCRREALKQITWKKVLACTESTMSAERILFRLLIAPVLNITHHFFLYF